jgi:hypothetical protein
MKGHRRTEIGVLENLSRNGFGVCIYIGIPFERGTEMSILANRVEFTGCVRQCISRENGYLVGVELKAPCRWPDGFVPEHLLDVTLLEFE